MPRRASARLHRLHRRRPGLRRAHGSRTRAERAVRRLRQQRGRERPGHGRARGRLPPGRPRRDDLLDGRGGSDEATYRDERRRVRADLAAGTALSAAGERDTLRSIERLEGGDGADILRGNGARNVIQGLAGDDLTRGARRQRPAQGRRGAALQGRARPRPAARRAPAATSCSATPATIACSAGPGATASWAAAGWTASTAAPTPIACAPPTAGLETVRCGAGFDRLRRTRRTAPLAARRSACASAARGGPLARPRPL